MTIEFHQFTNLLEILAVYVIECGQPLAVNVKHGHHLAIAAKDRHNDFRTRRAATGNMSWELFDVGDDDGLFPLPRSTANALAVRDVHTSNRALEGTKH